MTVPAHNIVPRYSAKAQAYQRYRWPFDRAAVRALMDQTGLDGSAVVVDIGAGTGLSSEPFLELGCEVYAVEPNEEMRQVASALVETYEKLTLLAQRGEQTTLPAHAADLIVVGRALHWLPQAAAREEFRRLSKPGGWLAVMAVKAVDEAYLAAVRSACEEEFGWDTRSSKGNRKTEPVGYFFDAAGYEQTAAPSIRRETWPQFLGRLLTMAPAPNEGDPGHDAFATRLRRIFDERQRDGLLEIPVITEILFGHPGQ